MPPPDDRVEVWWEGGRRWLPARVRRDYRCLWLDLHAGDVSTAVPVRCRRGLAELLRSWGYRDVREE